VVYIEVLILDILLYNDTVKIYKLELKPKYINIYNIYTTEIKKKKIIIIIKNKKIINHKKQKKDTS